MATAGQPVRLGVHIEGLKELERRFSYTGDVGFLEAQKAATREFGARLMLIYREEAPKSKEGVTRIAEATLSPKERRSAQGARSRARSRARKHTGLKVPYRASRGNTFAQSITYDTSEGARFDRSLSGTSAKGFGLIVRTPQGDKRTWLAHGTGIYGPRGQPITAKNSKALAFWWNGRPWVVKSVKGMKPQGEWEVKAYARAVPVVVEMGRRIGFTVTEQLTGRAVK